MEKEINDLNNDIFKLKKKLSKVNKKLRKDRISFLAYKSETNSELTRIENLFLSKKK